MSVHPVLSGVRVLDLADASGMVCGRILADLGADVVNVEPPGGEAARWAPPFAHDQPAADTSLTWLAANFNKRGITCSRLTLPGQRVFERLVEVADAVIETPAPGGARLDYRTLAASNPGLVLTSITPFGLDGPLAGEPASDLEITAASGSLWLAGDPDRPPVRNSLPQTPGWSGIAGAMGTLMALLARQTTGCGQQVDVSAQASMVAAISHAPVFWDLLREEQCRSGPFLVGRSVTGAVFRNIWPCRDGYVTFALYGGPAGRHTSKQLVAWMDERGGAPAVLRDIDWDTFDVNTVTPETVQALEAAIAPFLASLTRAEFQQGVIERDMLGYPVATTADIHHDEQLRARDFWQTVPAPWAATESVTVPGSFALLDGQRPPIRRTAPRVGEHNAEVYAEWLGLTAADLEALKAQGAI